MDSSKRALDIEEDTDGSICSIHVRNFFCHDNLQIDLNKNVNFVVGRNGSGKSAILTALVVGLGGKAAATNRGNNLQSFIKKGANSATVEIKVRNSSNLAYKPEIYGSYITVSRTINNSGGSSYKIKNASGEVVSTKFEEVKNIVIAHDIQVDNPISVLNQDDARSFHASDAKKKFMLFKRATNMDRTETNYEKALDNCKAATNTWKRKKEACDVLENEYKKLKVTHDRLQSHSEMEKRQKELENEYYWSEVVQYEREEQEIEDKRNRQQARVDKLEHELEAMQKSAGSNNGVVEELNAQLRQHNKQRGQLESELQARQEQLFAAQAALRGVAADAARRADQRRRERKKVADLKDGIAAIESGDASAKRAELERAAAAAREGADVARARYDTARNDAQQARLHAADAAARLDHAAAPPQRARAALRELKSKLQELGSGGDDALAVYGAKMAALVRAVKEATARGVFSAPPRGPVGAYVKVRDAKWAGALEHVLGGKLMEFCVNTDRDQRALFDIMRRIYGDAPKPGVTYSRFLPRRHDVAARRVQGGRHPSALDLMLIEDPVVANHLIDQLDVERVLMVPDHADAQRLSDRTENVPPNCKKIVTLDTTEFFPAPNYRSYGGVARASQYLAASTSERQRQLRAEIQEQETKLKQLEAAERKLKLEDADAKKAEKKAQETLELVMRELHRKEEAQRAAAAALDSTQKPHHAVLEKELHITEENLVALEEKLQEASQKEAEQKQKIDEIESAMRQTKKSLSELSVTCRNLAEEIDKEQMKVEQGATQQEAYRQRIPKEREKLELIERALTERRAAIAGKVAAAQRLCPRLARPRDKETVKQEIEATKSKLNSLRGEGRSRAEVEELMLRAAAQFRATSDQLDELQRLIAQCSRCTERHRHSALQLQRSVANLVQHHFNAMLTVNGYSGNMDIDFAKGLLDIKCTGRESSRLAASTASLSGGERSYSTVAFIMALWACVEVPFYFLDEFDVFMDNVNRRKVMHALLKHALDNRSRQFVFLTPQDASSVTASPQISIHVMADPRP